MNPDSLVQSNAANRGIVESRERGIVGAGQTMQRLDPGAAARPPIYSMPNLESLTSALSGVLCGDGLQRGRVVVLDRKPNEYASTYHTEIVMCRLPDGSQQRVLCKHSAGGGHNCYGHRGGLPYEAEVYRRVLAGIPLTAPALYGDLTDAETEESWLILEYVKNAWLVKHSIEPGAMGLAARWIGRFHALNEVRIGSAPMRFLNRYGAPYYIGWSHRTWLFTVSLHKRYPWLVDACDSYAKAIDWLLAQPLTVVHGEYYPVNVLFAAGTVYPVDWESAAIGVGEIDLACLTERWTEESAREMEVEYQRARWPRGAPVEFNKTLAAARLYLIFRWLGDRPEWTTSEECAWRFEQLRAASERWKSIGAD